MFATAIHFHLSIIFAGKDRSLPLEWSFVRCSTLVVFPVLPTNVRLGWKSMQVANTLAYYYTAIITTVKSFILQAPGVSSYFDKGLVDTCNHQHLSLYILLFFITSSILLAETEF